MTKIRKPGTNRACQDAFIDLLKVGHRVRPAAAAAGAHPTQFYNAARNDASFRDRWRAAKSERVQYRKPEQPWTHETGEAFLKAMVETGSANAAARKLGLCVSTAYAVRNRDADFAAAWAVARRQVAEQVDDKLLEGALHGYEEIVEVDGREIRRIRRANPRMMLRMVERIEADRRSAGGRWIELTPERVAAARDNLLRRLVDGGSLTTMAEAIDFASGKRTREEVFFPEGWPPPPKAAADVVEPPVAAEAAEPDPEPPMAGRSLWD